MLADLLFGAALPFLIAKRGASMIGGRAKSFLLFASLWLLGAVATDTIRSTPFEDIARGWSRLIFFAVNFTSIWLLVDGKWQRIVVFIYCLFIAVAIRRYFSIDQLDIDNAVFGSGWKFGYGQLLTATSFILSALLMYYPMTRLAGISLPFAASAVDLALNARNLFGITGLSAAVVAFASSRRRRRLSPIFLTVATMVGLATGWGLLSAYGYAAASGMLGVDAKDKYDLQSSGSLGILLGGRADSLASTQAIIDSPIIGHGSWARDISYVELMVSRLEAAGYEVEGDPLSSDLIPSHSHLLGAWVEAGILGAVFWLWASWIAICGLYNAITRVTVFTGFITFVGISLLWDILFSPFALERRVITAAWLILMILTIESAPSGTPQTRGS
jgi:hypothetical protein